MGAADAAMGIGSVKFFKRMIVLVYVLLVLLPVAAAIALGVLYGKEKHRADMLQEATLTEMAKLLNEGRSGENGVDITLNDLGPLASSQPATPSFAYQAMYPHLYAEAPLLSVAEENVCYLTFDDGPSPVTLEVLKALEEKNVKATFFVTGKNSQQNADALRAAAQAGHTIGVHSFSHEYQKIYSSVEEYLADFDEMYRLVEELTGAPPTVFRFPGGSINAYNQKVYTQIVAEMTRRGFVFFDWNAAASDAVKGGITRQQVVNNVMQSAAGSKRLIVLMHDRAENSSTAAALPAIIDGLAKRGFRFEALSSSVKPITYYYTENMTPAVNTADETATTNQE